MKYKTKTYKEVKRNLLNNYTWCWFCEKELILEDAIYLYETITRWGLKHDRYEGKFCNETCLNCHILRINT